MRVLLVGPDLESNLSLGYLAAALRRAGHTPREAPFCEAGDLDKVVALAAEADLVGLSMSFQWRAKEFLDLAAAIKAAYPERPVIAGGHFASCAAFELLRDYAALDLIVLHEGEHTIVELCSLGSALLSQAGTVPGVVWRSPSGLSASATRHIDAALDDLPWPERPGPARLLAGVPTAYLMGSRGCVRQCEYCCIASLHQKSPGPKFRRRSIDNIVAEMADLYHARGVRQFVFHDDNFLVPSPTHNAERLGDFAAALADAKVEDIGLVMKCGPEDLDRASLKTLTHLGLVRIFMGIESGTQAGLDALGRRQRVEANDAALTLCEELGVSSQYTTIIFHPAASPETMLADLAFVERHPTHPLNFCRAEIYAGTPLEQRLLAQGRCHGTYMARAFEYDNAEAGRVWSLARELFNGRAWGTRDLLSQVIHLDHEFAVLAHFYRGRRVPNLCRRFAALETQVNLETVALFRRIIELAMTQSSSATWAQALAELRAAEHESRARLQEELCAMRKELRKHTEPLFDLVRAPQRFTAWGKLPQHAAAVMVAAGLLGGVAGAQEQHPVAEAAPPPYQEQFPVAEAAPPPYRDLPKPAAPTLLDLAAARCPITQGQGRLILDATRVRSLRPPANREADALQVQVDGKPQLLRTPIHLEERLYFCAALRAGKHKIGWTQEGGISGEPRPVVVPGGQNVTLILEPAQPLPEPVVRPQDPVAAPPPYREQEPVAEAAPTPYK